MPEKDLNTEQKILVAAKKVFVEKGMEGARMQQIADEAGINKALLHYYFRSKDKLFEAVFKESFYKIVPNIVELMKGELSLFEKISLFAESYIEIIIENPFIPGFVLHELNRNPQRIVDLISNIGIEPKLFAQQIDAEFRKGNIRKVDPFHLIVNMLAMCVFPFVATPILKTVIFEGNDENFEKFIEERKKSVPQFIINSIKKHE